MRPPAPLSSLPEDAPLRHFLPTTSPSCRTPHKHPPTSPSSPSTAPDSSTKLLVVEDRQDYDPRRRSKGLTNRQFLMLDKLFEKDLLDHAFYRYLPTLIPGRKRGSGLSYPPTAQQLRAWKRERLAGTTLSLLEVWLGKILSLVGDMRGLPKTTEETRYLWPAVMLTAEGVRLPAIPLKPMAYQKYEAAVEAGRVRPAGDYESEEEESDDEEERSAGPSPSAGATCRLSSTFRVHVGGRPRRLRDMFRKK